MKYRSLIIASIVAVTLVALLLCWRLTNPALLEQAESSALATTEIQQLLPPHPETLLVRKQAYLEQLERHRTEESQRSPLLLDYYDYVGSPSEGLTFVATRNKENPSSYSAGYVDRNNQLVIPLSWGYLPSDSPDSSQFSQGRAVVYSHETGLYGMIDQKGAVIIPPNYNYLSPYSEGLTLAITLGQEPTTTYFDLEGTVVISPLKGIGFPFSSGVAAFLPTQAPGSDPLVSYLDLSGQMILEDIGGLPLTNDEEIYRIQSLNSITKSIPRYPDPTMEETQTSTTKEFLNQSGERYRIETDAPAFLEDFELPFVGTWQFDRQIVWLGDQRAAIVDGQGSYRWAVVAITQEKGATSYHILVQNHSEEHLYSILWFDSEFEPGASSKTDQ